MFEAIFGGCGGECGGCCFGVTLILVVCLVLVGGAAIYVASEGPEPPLSDKFTPKAAEAQAFDAEISRATSQASTQGWFYLTFTERQIASWMALDGEEFAAEQGHDFPFENVQVSLKDGAITFYGELQRIGLALPIAATIEPKIDSSGEMKLEVTSVDVGGVQMPDAVLRSIERQFEDVLLAPFDNLPGTPFFIEQSLSIEDGTFTVQGRVN